ncbi:MAG: RluA family pseudouridine synthase [Firmicutes bacterium]|jgi:23S rRNA pseudouridine1911/1915/1917 synthase|nr:RluA family pseudouridine synthase [Bacillota bacterium]MDH7496445.1 RluA family pseudouridine synthase [Bacillota bacterium]
MDRSPLEIHVDEADEGKRLDVYVAGRLALSRSATQRLIDEGRVLVAGERAKAARRVGTGDIVTVSLPDPRPLAVVAEDLPLDVLYEDCDIIVVNKPRGLVVHPAAGNWSGTLVNALLAHCADLSGIGGKIRPGIVHRLDKDTSGVIVAAKNDVSHLALARDLKERAVDKTYLAVVHGVPRPRRGTVDAPIGRHPVHRKRMAVVPEGRGRAAVTEYEVLEDLRGSALVKVHPLTGRTHQIRVHLAHIGHPIVGDPVYGGRARSKEVATAVAASGLSGQALHASSLSFAHPRTRERMTFSAPLPEDMQRLLTRLRQEPQVGP